MMKPLLVVVVLVCLNGYVWSVASAMPQQSFKSFWLADTTLNHEPDHRSDALCAGQPDSFYPIEGCTGNYYACIEQIYYPQVCPSGGIFDPALLKCVSPGTASCITTIPPTTTTTIKPFSCPTDGYYPVATCSSSYYICIGTDVYPQMCPGGGVFEPSLLTCVSADTAPCKATTTTSTTTTTTTTTLPPFTCTADGFYEIAPCMQTYYICIGGVEYPETCPGTGIFVGPPTSACKQPEDTTCFLTTELPTPETPTAETPTAETPTAETPTAETPTAETPTAETPTAETPTTETPTAETPNPACICANGANTCYQPLRPDICIQDYYSCFNGSLYPQSCPYPNVFDPALGGCTGPSNTSCSKTTTALSSP
ncbi:putative Peritrophic matrix protein [Daphnia magna]|uniref:Putative Peritrophic matrix protein n=1 Tax=Daphnia magna TaxID=35525 RepID=A0A162SRF4_9CRUS|nr:putative Peritrophic matrix protein [Daphnia magna]